jgi:hypothetical protein
MSSKKSEIYEWLEQQGSDGEYQAEGHFTLKHDEAWAKLAAYQIPIEEGWVLKLVQAVTAHSAASLRVTQLARETVFTVLEVTNWTRDVVEDTLFSIDKDSGNDVDHLGLAIRFLVQVKQRPFSIRYSDQEKVVWTGEKFVSAPSSNRTGFELRVGHFTIKERKQVLNLTGAAGAAVGANIACALRRHCHLAPTPILLDGYRVTSCLNDEDFGTPSRGRPLGLFRVPKADALPTFQLPPVDPSPKAKIGRQVAYLEDDSVLRSADNEACCVAGILSVFVKDHSSARLGAQRSKILWFNDGVIVHREPLDLEPRATGVGILISSQGLETDLSGMIPRHSEEYVRRKGLAVSHIHGQLERLVEGLDESSVKTRPSYTQTASIFGGAGLLFLFSLTTAGVCVGLLGGLEYLFSRSQIRNIESTLEKSLRALADDLEQFSKGLR